MSTGRQTRKAAACARGVQSSVNVNIDFLNGRNTPCARNLHSQVDLCAPLTQRGAVHRARARRHVKHLLDHKQRLRHDHARRRQRCRRRRRRGALSGWKRRRSRFVKRRRERRWQRRWTGRHAAATFSRRRRKRRKRRRRRRRGCRCMRVLHGRVHPKRDRRQQQRDSKAERNQRLHVVHLRRLRDIALVRCQLGRRRRGVRLLYAVLTRVLLSLGSHRQRLQKRNCLAPCGAGTTRRGRSPSFAHHTFG